MAKRGSSAAVFEEIRRLRKLKKGLFEIVEALDDELEALTYAATRICRQPTKLARSRTRRLAHRE